MWGFLKGRSTSKLGKAEGIADVPALSPGRTANVILGRLKRAIETGIYASGGQLPAERQVAVTFGAARSTVSEVGLQSCNIFVFWPRVAHEGPASGATCLVQASYQFHLLALVEYFPACRDPLRH